MSESKFDYDLKWHLLDSGREDLYKEGFEHGVRWALKNLHKRRKKVKLNKIPYEIISVKLTEPKPQRRRK